ncbi:MAG: minor capsid protein [Coriobacteriia bacterium]|nr:minor capsid protein [Coriobacteriia bacterium]
MSMHVGELYGEHEIALRDIGAQVIGNVYGETLGTLGVMSPGLDKAVVDKILARPWGPNGQTFSQRVWGSQSALIETLEKEVTQGMIRGATTDQMAKRLTDIFGVTRSNARRLVITETAAFSVQGDLESYANLGVTSAEILEQPDCCPICQPLNGQEVLVSEIVAGVTVPPFHPYCRGTTIPLKVDGESLLLDDETYENDGVAGGKGTSLGSPKKMGMSFYDGSDDLRIWTRKVAPADGYYDVSIHGSSTGFGYVDAKGNWVDVSVSDLADSIKSMPSYSGEGIRLLSCSSGKLADGPAQHLANMLGVTVLAPTEDLYFWADGSMLMTDTEPMLPDEEEVGEWILFHQKKR